MVDRIILPVLFGLIVAFTATLAWLNGKQPLD
jgi:hypothetical protein